MKNIKKESVVNEEKQDLSILEESRTAYDPTTQHIDLSHLEKRRVTALMMAIQAYKNLLIPDAAYLEKAADLARRDEGPKIQAGTINAMVIAAMQFDDFIAGIAVSSDATHHD